MSAPTVAPATAGASPASGVRHGGSGRPPGRRLVVVVAVIAGLVGGGVGAGGTVLFDRPASVSAPPVPAGPAVVNGSDVPALLARVLPAVVSIQTRLASGGQGAGTGMVISADGEVLTNAHVVSGASTITVTRYGTTQALPARLVGA